jgi:Protein of unknown function (DUF1524)
MPRFQWDTLGLLERPAVKYEKDHIEPKNPENPTLGQRVKWLETDEESKPFAEVCLHRLGKLVLDTVSAGSSKSDRCFAERIPHYTDRSALLSQQEVVTRFASKDGNGSAMWDVVAIRRRHEALVGFATSL